jgi:hypothetical protein
MDAALVCSLCHFPKSLRSQLQRPLEARYVSALLWSLILGEAVQERFGSLNALSLSGFPGFEIGEGSNRSLFSWTA